MFDNVFGPEQTHAMREALELVAERLRATNGEFDARRRQQLADIVLDVVAQSPEDAADADALAKQTLRHIGHLTADRMPNRAQKLASHPAKPGQRATEAA